MKGFQFSKYNPDENLKSVFEKLLDLFLQLLTYTSGDAAEALQWLTEINNEHKITGDEYGIGDFLDELIEKGYLNKNENQEIKISSKTEQGIRKKSMEEIFGKLKKTKQGNHNIYKSGLGDEINPDTRSFQFGDTMEQIDFTSSIKNAQINHGIDSFSMQEDD